MYFKKRKPIAATNILRRTNLVKQAELSWPVFYPAETWAGRHPLFLPPRLISLLWKAINRT